MSDDLAADAIAWAKGLAEGDVVYRAEGGQPWKVRLTYWERHPGDTFYCRVGVHRQGPRRNQYKRIVGAEITKAYLATAAERARTS